MTDNMGIIINGKRHDIDEFTDDQVGKICDIIDEMAKMDKTLHQCTLDAEGDDNAEYLCDLIDNWYKQDVIIPVEKVAELALVK
ncbi:MAG: hypothetical protein EOM59_13825 [Clostridia bacterium]|nr:hypothetical protein [Clostridia bacterium]